MKISTLLLVAALAVIGVFAALNWPAFTQSTTLSLGFAAVTAPLGLVLLGMLVALSVLFLAYLVTLQTSVLLETRRHARELQAHRALADQAEASRFTELRKFIESELQLRTVREVEMHEALVARMERLDESVRGNLQDANNTMAAYMGEMEDLIEHGRRPLPGAAVAASPAASDIH